MFVRTLDELEKLGRIKFPADESFRSARLLTAADGFGFSDVRLEAGAEAILWYKHHWQANHIVSGSLEVTDITTGETWALGPSMACNVGPKDRHRVRAHADTHLLSAVSPPLMGDERHDEDGVPAPSGPAPPGPPGY